MAILRRAIAHRLYRMPIAVCASTILLIAALSKEQAVFRNPTSSKFARNRTTNKSLNVVLAILFGGTASLAIAQSPKESFADTFATLQSLSSNSSNWQREKPVFSEAPTKPSAGSSLREMQALSSDSPVWQIDQGKVQFDRGATFAQTHPHGLSFSQYQAYASNSGEFALGSSDDMSTIAATAPAVHVNGVTTKPKLGERFANLLHRGGTTNTTEAK